MSFVFPPLRRTVCEPASGPFGAFLSLFFRSERKVRKHFVSPKADSASDAPLKIVPGGKPSRKDVSVAVRSLIEWIGDDPEREGLIETPDRVLRALEEHFAGYRLDAREVLSKTFSEIDNYDEMIVLRGVCFESHCEHHMEPFVGQAWIGYIPNGRVVGISKLARVVDIYAKRLQTQERLTSQIANSIDEILKPRGVGVVIRASHRCMSSRGVRKHGASLVTKRMLGSFRTDEIVRQEFLAAIGYLSTQRNDEPNRAGRAKDGLDF